MDYDLIVPGKTTILNMYFYEYSYNFYKIQMYIKCSQYNKSMLKLKRFVENGKFIDVG